MEIKFKRLHDAATIPTYAHGNINDAGMDLYAAEECHILVGARKLIRCGFAMEIPSGCEAQIRSRSGLAMKHGVTVLNSPGTIDPSYRGEIAVLLQNQGEVAFRVKVGDRIAQMVVSRYIPVHLSPVVELTETPRGEGGFGSTDQPIDRVLKVEGDNHINDTQRLEWVLRHCSVTNYTSLQTSDVLPCNLYSRDDIDKWLNFKKGS